LNIQTERLTDSHKARLTVTLSNEEYDKAQQKAATKLSGRYSIPGFRKGKAPFNVVVKYLGLPAIIEEATSILADEYYPKALEQSGLTPGAPGQLEDIKPSPEFTMIFSLELAPEVELGDYKAVRVPYEISQVTDEQVTEVLESLRLQRAESVANEGEIEVGDRVTVNIHSHFTDGDETPEDETEIVDGKAYKDGEFYHSHDEELLLSREKEPILAGFIDQIVGAKAGDNVEFELTIPTDNPEFSDVAGRVVKFSVSIEKADKVVLPALDDEFAAQLTSNDPEPLNLEQLRERIKTNMQMEAEREYSDQYETLVMDKIVESSKIAYPESMVKDRIDSMVKNFEERLSQNGLSFEIYGSITGVTAEKMRETSRPEAELYVKRSVVLMELVEAENVKIDVDELNDQLAILQSQINSIKDKKMRKTINVNQQREALLNRMVYGKLMERITKRAKGEEVVEETTPTE
jgi:trigger factor